jgi:hypothetical protein
VQPTTSGSWPAQPERLIENLTQDDHLPQARGVAELSAQAQCRDRRPIALAAGSAGGGCGCRSLSGPLGLQAFAGRSLLLGRLSRSPSLRFESGLLLSTLALLIAGTSLSLLSLRPRLIGRADALHTV